jgi:predicted amidohydrolase
MSDLVYEANLPVGIVQTTIDAEKAWKAGANSPAMAARQDEHSWQETAKAMRAFQDNELRPRVVLFPELSLPRTRLDEFDHLVAALNVIAVAGVDYRLDHRARTARNEGIVFVPRNFFRARPARYCSRIIFGKTYAPPKEKEKLRHLSPAWSFQGDHNVYVFDCHQYGRIGISICYDFMDIERALMYRGKIQHLFVPAYNRDLGMFRSLADALSRTVFCNVVVCNTGHHGGSLAVSPYYAAFRRTLYLHEGPSLFTTQVVQLPVRDLVEAQRGRMEKSGRREADQQFKQPPPGVPTSRRRQELALSFLDLRPRP